MKKIVAIACMICLFSCTKETYVEGLVPAQQTAVLNKVIPIVSNQQSSLSITINGHVYQFNTGTDRFKATNAIAASYSNCAVNDSVIQLRIASDLLIDKKNNNCFTKYNYGDTVQLKNYSTGGAYVFAAVKKYPYTGGYQACTSINGYPAAWGINQGGYLAFLISPADMLPTYGWIHLDVTESMVYVDKCGYQTTEPIRMGAE